MNFLPENGLAEYVLTGSWVEKAFDEASRIGNTKIAGTSKDKNYSYIPDLDQLKPDPGASYIHITSNNTIYGTRWKQFPFYNHRPPVIADMSSDILSRKINIGRFSLIYAGAQKNLGPAGVTVVIIDKNFAENANIHLPSMLAYKTHIDKKSLFNTPPVFAIYFIKLVLDWVKEMGGVEKIESLNLKKAKLLYDLIDSSNGFYQGKAHKEYRSLMNITLSLNDSHLENAFLKAAHKEGFIGLKGHRSLGGIRISIYNSMPLEGIIRLVDFMNRFQHVHM
jgi:phosphoserine aminotransferase